MPYQLLVELIDKYKTELATRIAQQAVVLKVIDGSQMQADTQGFAASLGMIATYIRDKNIKEWQKFVEEVTKHQVARGVLDEAALAISDYMIQQIYDLIERELGGSANATLRNKFLQRVQTMHSVGKVMILVTQMKEKSSLVKR